MPRKGWNGWKAGIILYFETEVEKTLKNIAEVTGLLEEEIERLDICG
jgi:hypothetical protein